MYTVVVGMGPEEQEKRFKNFSQAFAEFYRGVRMMVRQGTSLQVLETACWIAYEGPFADQTVKTVMGFYDLRDFAYEHGLLVDRELVEPLPPIDDAVVIPAMLQGMLNGFMADLQVDLDRMQRLLDEATVELVTKDGRGNQPNTN